MADQFNIAIVGAGIGGLALAIGLTHHRIPFIIYESAPAFSAVGAGVGLGPNALRAMDLIDKRFRDRYMGIATGNSTPDKKHVMMEAMRMEVGLGESESWWGQGTWGAPYFERTGAHRKDLLDIMTSFINKDAIKFGSTVAGIEQSGNEVTLTFTDGRVATHAAVIGCGGINGPERRHVLGERYPDSVEPQYTHKYVYRTIMSMEEATRIMGDLAADAKMYMSRNSNLSTYPISGGKQVNVIAFKRDPGPWMHTGNTFDVSMETMLSDFSDMELDARLLRLLEHFKPTQWAIFDHPTTPTYYNSLVCLLGDVAHASSPHQAGGAGQSLEDALLLTHALAVVHSSPLAHTLNTPSSTRTRALQVAFEAYEGLRRPRAQRQVVTARECGEIYNLRDPVTGGEWEMEHVLKELAERWDWLWEWDLEGDIGRVRQRVGEGLRGVGLCE